MPFAGGAGGSNWRADRVQIHGEVIGLLRNQYLSLTQQSNKGVLLWHHSAGTVSGALRPHHLHCLPSAWVCIYRFALCCVAAIDAKLLRAQALTSLWLAAWPVLFQPAIGVLMAGAVRPAKMRIVAAVILLLPCVVEASMKR